MKYLKHYKVKPVYFIKCYTNKIKFIQKGI